jgi:hypothetical protein
MSKPPDLRIAPPLFNRCDWLSALERQRGEYSNPRFGACRPD